MLLGREWRGQVVLPMLLGREWRGQVVLPMLLGRGKGTGSSAYVTG
jgi:hypothetical protein